MQNRRFAFAVLCLLGITPVSGSAAILTFTFEGHVIDKHDPVGRLTFGKVGDAVAYAFSFDPQAAGTILVPTLAFYPGIASELAVGATQITSGVPRIQIQHPLDLFNVSSSLNVDIPGLLPDGSIYFRLSDQAESNALTSIDLPLTPYNLAPFASRAFSVSFLAPQPGGSSERIGFSGLIDRFVPEPNTLVLMMSAAIALMRRPRRL